MRREVNLFLTRLALFGNGKPAPLQYLIHTRGKRGIGTRGNDRILIFSKGDSGKFFDGRIDLKHCKLIGQFPIQSRLYLIA